MWPDGARGASRRGSSPSARLLGAAFGVATLVRGQAVAAQACQCGVTACASVLIGEDNAADLGCDDARVGQSLPDSDGDGIPDACDLCACKPNAFDEDTGRYATCPAEPPHPEPPGPPPPATTPKPPKLECVDGRLVGSKEHLTLWFLRPTAFLYTADFDAATTRYSAGGRIILVNNLDTISCVTDSIDGHAAPRITGHPNWFARVSGYGSASVRSGWNFSLTTGLEAGLDYVPTAGFWSLGPNLHAMTVVFDGHVPLFVGAGARLGLLDVIAVTPFAQWDVLDSGAMSYGLWFDFDWGVLEDLGVRVPD